MTRRLLFLILAIAFIGPLCAQPGKFSVSTTIDTPFRIYVDEILQNETPVRSISITKIPVGKHRVEVVLDDGESHSFGQYFMINHLALHMVITHQGYYYGWQQTTRIPHSELTMPLETHDTPLMTDREFETALNALKSESYDNTRLILAKQIVSQNLMKASQVAEICKLFSFESNRLELAKFAYSHCGEKNRYYLVNASFAYDATKRELDEYIKGN